MGVTVPTTDELQASQAAQDARLAALEQAVKELKAQVDSLSRPGLLVGGWAQDTVDGLPRDEMASQWATAASVLGPWRVRRSFDSKIPTSYAASAAGIDPDLGALSVHSIKPPGGDVAGLTAGKYDAQLRALYASFPADRVSYAICYHEPEDNMSGATYVAMHRRWAEVARAAHPNPANLVICYAANGYRWGYKPTAETANPDAWYPGDAYVDMLGVDVYSEYWQPGHPLPLAELPSFARWATWAEGTGKRLAVFERGISLVNNTGAAVTTGQARADVMLQDAELLRSRGYEMLLWWDGPGHTGLDYTLNDSASIAAARQIAAG